MATQDDLEAEGKHGFSEEAEQDWIDASYKGVIEEPDLPPEIARDSEIYEAICTHKKDANAHHVPGEGVGNGVPWSYRIATGEAITVDAYEQLLIYGEYLIEGSGALTINSTGQLTVIGA